MRIQQLSNMGGTPDLAEAGCATEPSVILDYYRCQQLIPGFSLADGLNGEDGFFCFGPDLVCYGRSTSPVAAAKLNGDLFDAVPHVRCNGNTTSLPFDVNQVVDNLRHERYVKTSGWRAWPWVSDIYYHLRPLLPIAVRKHLQRAYLSDWKSIKFPSWPLDRTIDLLLERLLFLGMKTSGITRLPFIWFWPHGHKACAIVTHDVETTVGRDFCGSLMDIDDEFGIKAAFQVVPEERYAVSDEYLQTIRDRGFEINVHGLNHDGNLFKNRKLFLQKAEKINCYAKHYGALGFRSPSLHRNTDWFQDLNFSYDMSFPNVSRLEAQRGGCCTVMPYFLPGGITELPLTTTEDYTLFHVLKDYSTTVWKGQIDAILEGHGLITILVHPDYVLTKEAQDLYKELLEIIGRLKTDRGLWVTLPREVDRWWRERSAMNLVADGSGLRIEGAGHDRARVAYACLAGDRLVYEIES